MRNYSLNYRENNTRKSSLKPKYHNAVLDKPKSVTVKEHIENIMKQYPRIFTTVATGKSYYIRHNKKKSKSRKKKETPVMVTREIKEVFNTIKINSIKLELPTRKVVVDGINIEW